MKPKTQARPHGFSISEELLCAARERARHQGRNFSNYVCYLIRQDLQQETNNAKPTGERNRQRLRQPA
ncbi:MAG: hypothetical protein ABSG59_22890 [Verrucomicrobiota bacterium]|jgi:hypothetical protein